jgi:hypothetical protein
VDYVEMLLQQILTLLAVHLGQGLLGNILIAMRNYLRIHEQLRAAVNVSKSLTAPVNSQTQDSTFRIHIYNFHIPKVIQLRYQKGLKGSVVPAYDPQQLQSSSPPRLDFGVPKVEVNEKVDLFFKQGDRSLGNSNIG